MVGEFESGKHHVMSEIIFQMFARCVLRVPSLMPTVVGQQARAYSTGDSFKKREKMEEERSIREHEKEVIRRLREQIKDMENEKQAKEAVGKVADPVPPPPPVASDNVKKFFSPSCDH